jgi:hypothetical protein
VNWYRRSLSDHDTHRGHLRHGRVMAVCGMEFSPLRAWRKGGSALRGEPTDPEQICLECHRTSLPGEPSPAFQSPRVDRSESHD